MTDVFKNYFPIASKRPHDYDIYQLGLATNDIKQITNEKAYSMASLGVKPDGKELMCRSFADGDEIVFLSLKDKQEKKIVTVGDLGADFLCRKDGCSFIAAGIATAVVIEMFARFIVNYRNDETIQ